MDYKFIYDDKQYILSEKNFDGFYFDNDEDEIKGLDLDCILNSLSEYNGDVTFTAEYYASSCKCKKQEALNKSYKFLEFHFYIYSKDQNYVINTLAKEYENTSFNKLFSTNKIDRSYIASIILCPECQTFSIDISECDV